MAGLHGRSPLLRLQTDERLVALVRRGNQSAFEALVARYQSRLLAFCRHMLGSREDAEDVLQEVFAAAFNAMLADERPLNVRPWLYRIARNRSLNHLRRTQPIGVDSMDVHYSEGGITTADKVHRREDFRLLLVDVQGLPETQRTALLLREIDALSYEQIAEAMDTTVPSVKSLLVRARVSLAEAAEARQLSCDQVRLELGEVAEGLRKLSPPARRHVKTCERCSIFRQQLRETNKALAAVMPVGPLLLFKKLVLAHLGSTASGGATAAGTAAGGAAGSAAAGGALSAGASAVASKTVAGIAAAAIVTAGAVEVRQVAVDSSDRGEPVGAAVAPGAAAPVRAALRPVTTAARQQPTLAARTAETRPAADRPVPPTDPTATPRAETPAPAPAPAPPPPTRTQTGSSTTTLPATTAPTENPEEPGAPAQPTDTTSSAPSDAAPAEEPEGSSSERSTALEVTQPAPATP